MSYNTRRTGAAGRGGPTTQVNYHQQPGRTVGGAVQSRNPGYSTTNSQSTYNSSAQPAFSTQAGYTTAPPLPAQTPKSQPPATAAPQPPTPAQTPSQKPQQPPPQKPPVTPQPTVKPETQPTPQRTVKPEPPPTPQSADTSTTSENGDGGPKPFWKKKPFVKVSNKIRKARQNAKLRRILNPKNALTFLNELRPGGVKFVIREEPGWGFVASVDIDGKTYSGHALTVSKAKVQASEQALKSVLLEQLSKAQSAVPPAVEKKENEVKQENDNEPMDTNETTSTEEESAESKSKKKLEPPLEDEMPWGSLAAFALHKLFAEWQKDGTESHAPPLEKYEDEIAEEAYFSRRPVPPPPEFGYPRRFVPGGVYRGGRGYAPYPPRGGPPPLGFGPIIRRPPPPPASTFLTQGAPKPALPLTAASSMMPMKKIPDDANKRHPVMILNQLKPNVIYTESREGQPPHVVFIITVELDGKEYVGRGKSKKDAKKSAAKAALAPLGIIYDDEN